MYCGVRKPKTFAAQEITAFIKMPYAYENFKR